MTSRRFDDRQVVLWITITVLMGGFLCLLAPIPAPVLLASILAYILGRFDIQVSKDWLFEHVASGVYNARTGQFSS
jgi:predicted PurR-regulated permease PerM